MSQEGFRRQNETVALSPVGASRRGDRGRSSESRPRRPRVRRSRRPAVTVDVIRLPVRRSKETSLFSPLTKGTSIRYVKVHTG